MNKLLIVIFFVVGLSVKGSTPTVEGLFRNPSNGDITTNTVLITFSIKKELSEEMPMAVSDDSSGDTKELSEYFVKYIFDLSLKSQVRLVKVYYSKKQMRSEDILSVKYYDSISSSGLKRDQLFFNSLLSVLVLNRSTEMINYLKNISKDVKENREVLDREKMNLLSRYKAYLKSKEDSPETENPLKPEGEEAQERVKSVLQKPLLTTGKEIKLVRRGERFEWNLTLDAVQGTFENESLKMKKLEVQNVSDQDQVYLDNYLLVNGVHEFPKYFKVILNGQAYNIDLIRLRNFDSKKTSIRERYKNYNKKVKELKIETRSITMPLI